MGSYSISHSRYLIEFPWLGRGMGRVRGDWFRSGHGLGDIDWYGKEKERRG